MEYHSGVMHEASDSIGDQYMRLRAERFRRAFSGLSTLISYPLLVALPVPAMELHSLQSALLHFFRRSIEKFGHGAAGPDFRIDSDAFLSLPNITPNGVVKPYEETLPEYGRVVGALAAVLVRTGVMDELEMVQIPPNVRCVRGVTEQKVLERAYSTSKLHTDVWAGEPLHSMNFILPVLGSVESAAIRFAQPKEVPPELRRPLDDYRSATLKEADLHLYDIEPRLGVLYCFDTFVLHQTVRKASGVRISIDFRGLYRERLPAEESAWEAASPYVDVEDARRAANNANLFVGRQTLIRFSDSPFARVHP